MAYDVIVIGAGAMGSSAAWWLARRGASVLLLEQFDQGHRRGSSHGGSRIYRFAYTEPDYVRLAMDALPLWRELEADAAEPLLDTTGGVDMGNERALDLVVDALAANGAAFERLSAAAATERFPGMRFDTPVVFQPQAGRCRADATVAALQRRAAAHGADVRFNAGRARLTATASGVSVAFGDELAEAPVAVVAAGAWAAETLAGTGITLPPLHVTQEQIQHFPDRVAGREWPSFIDHSRGVRMGVYGLRTPGEGVKVARHLGGAPVTADTRTFELDPAGLEAMTRYVEAWMPGLVPTPVHPATCLYTTTPSEDFIIDRAGPVVVASPCSGHGFKFTPIIGRMVADIVAGGPVHPRFRLPHGPAGR
jgi:sarcosine oxidase